MIDLYFNAYLDLNQNWKKNSCRKNLIDLMFFLTYFTIAIPLIVYLAGRVSEKKPSTLDEYLARHILHQNKSYKQIRAEAERGCPQCQYHVGLDYFVGMQMARNDVEGIKWLEKAGESGYLPAIRKILSTYSDRCPIEMQKPLYWASKGAHLNDAFCQRWLASLYERGLDHLSIDKDMAKTWYKKAADQGDQKAIEKLKDLEFS